MIGTDDFLDWTAFLSKCRNMVFVNREALDDRPTSRHFAVFQLAQQPAAKHSGQMLDPNV
jgi:hypothetical protein